MEAEYIALCQSLRELIAIGEVVEDIQTFEMAGKCKTVQFSTHAKAFNLDKNSSIHSP